jgi:hypothetical protein
MDAFDKQSVPVCVNFSALHSVRKHVSSSWMDSASLNYYWKSEQVDHWLWSMDENVRPEILIRSDQEEMNVGHV